jgi:hypothetical protein
VLDFGLSEKSDGIFRIHTVKARRGQVQGIPEVDEGVELVRQGFEVGLFCVWFIGLHYISIVMWKQEREEEKNIGQFAMLGRSTSNLHGILNFLPCPELSRLSKSTAAQRNAPWSQKFGSSIAERHYSVW